MSQEQVIEKALATITRTLAADVDTPNVAMVATSNEGEVKVCDSQNAVIEGFLLTTGKAGDKVAIVVAGIVPVGATGAIARGKYLITSSNGLLFQCPMTSGTTYNIAAKAYTKCTAAGEFVSVMPLMTPLRLKT